MSFLEALFRERKISADVLGKAIRVANLIAKCCGPSLNEVILFGSHLDGKATPTSDIDLLIVIDRRDWEFEERQEAAKLYAATEEANLGWERLHFTIVRLDGVKENPDEAVRQALCFGKRIHFNPSREILLKPRVEQRHVKKAFGPTWGGMMN